MLSFTSKSNKVKQSPTILEYERSLAVSIQIQKQPLTFASNINANKLEANLPKIEKKIKINFKVPESKSKRPEKSLTKAEENLAEIV